MYIHTRVIMKFLLGSIVGFSIAEECLYFHLIGEKYRNLKCSGINSEMTSAVYVKGLHCPDGMRLKLPVYL